ncbi:MAG: AI-2E family transporter [Bacteroidia bacterium]
MTQSFLYRATFFLLFICLFFTVLVFGKPILAPIFFAAFLSLLMLPVAEKFEDWKIHRGIAAGISIFLLLLILSGIIFLLTHQMISFLNDLPALKDKILTKLDRVQLFIEEHLGVTSQDQVAYYKSHTTDLLETIAANIQAIVATTTGTIITVGIIVIFMFFFLLYRDKFKKFLFDITPDDVGVDREKIIVDVSVVTQQYIAGLGIVILILAVLNTIGLLIIGIEQAVFFGVLAALLNLIPYIGSALGSIFPIIMALLTKDSLWYAVAVAGVMLFNQFLENNFLTPNIVGSKVKINPLAAILAILIGGMVWGVAGMVLFIPLLGILKVVLDNVPSMKPYADLIGGNGSEEHKGRVKKVKVFRRNKRAD